MPRRNLRFHQLKGASAVFLCTRSVLPMVLVAHPLPRRWLQKCGVGQVQRKALRLEVVQ